VSRREQIEMSDEEQRGFIENGHTAILTSISKEGRPHPVPMWYVVMDDLVHLATYTKSQKVRNLRRNPSCAVLFATGEVYEELRGLLIQGRAEIRDDGEAAYRVERQLYEKYVLRSPAPPGNLPETVEELLRNRARKRSAVIVHPERISSWDHRKLGGIY
jgi:PPOX class probable F420-dependent enzyme